METLIQAIRDAGFFSFSETLCDSEKCDETRHIFAQFWAKGKGYGGRSLWGVRLGDTYALMLWSGRCYSSDAMSSIERTVLKFLKEGVGSYELSEAILSQNTLVRDDDLIDRVHGNCNGNRNNDVDNL
jgi:hypothetical protein